LHSFVRERWRSDWTRQDAQGDGYATGLSTFVLQQAGISREDPRLRRGLSWLARNQNKADGFWPSFSLTKHRSPDSNVGHFMDDAATGYAVLALSEAHAQD
jgi:squalene-hopene/tetraprenyl-beta-curcumene cyclase